MSSFDDLWALVLWLAAMAGASLFIWRRTSAPSSRHGFDLGQYDREDLLFAECDSKLAGAVQVFVRLPYESRPEFIWIDPSKLRKIGARK